MELKDIKAVFLEGEIWMLTISGAFQRANVYQKDADEEARKDFRNKLHKKLLEMLEAYHTEVNEDAHLLNIKNLSNFTREFENILQGGKLNFGVSQKLLNLYLKYQWCLGIIPTPPHFPVDRVIQEALKIPENEIVPWTQIQEKDGKCYTEDNRKCYTEEDYLRIINLAREALQKHENKQLNSIAELELYLFSRKNEK